MLRRTLLSILAASLLAPAANHGQLDQIIEETRRAFQVPGLAVAIVHNDAVIYAKGFGVKSLSTNAPVTTSTRFAIASTTKAFTTAAMGLLVDEGKMNWDDPVRKHVPFFRLSDPLANENVTLRDIVSHRTGLSRHDNLWYNSPWSREEIIRKIGLVPLTKPFRSAYQYQNIMFLTAGYAVGLTSAKGWEGFLRERILEPLGMRNTDFSAHDAMKAPDAATPYELRENKVTDVPWLIMDNLGPAGSMNSSVDDLSRWVRMQLNEGVFEGKRIIKAATLKETHTPQTPIRMDDPNMRTVNDGTHMMAYGLGWTIQDYRGHRMVSHGGAINGFRAQVALLPDEKYGIILLSNLGSINMVECLRTAIADHLLALPETNWNAKYLAVAQARDEASKKQLAERDAKRQTNTKPSHQLSAYSGAYTHPAYGEAHLSATASGLELQWSNWKTPLEHFHFDTFHVKGGATPLRDSLIQFQLKPTGEVESVQFLDQTFRRKQ
ncbi:MAG: serine hydrolase [Acidobacteria bacterium]|nr:serine hydrolase [Acidobacteriota bacterium]